MFAMKEAEIGGAVVRRVFSSGGKQLTPGTRLTGDEVRKIPKANRNALVGKHFMELFPAGDVSAPTGGERFVVSMGFGKFVVIEGRKMTAEPLDREQAYALAGQPVPNGKPSRQRKTKPVPSA